MPDKLLSRCAVITGDVVKSSKLPDSVRRQLPGLLRKAYRELQGMAPTVFPEKSLAYPVAVYRGDAFQMIITDASFAIHAAVAYRALVLATTVKPKIEVRMAIGMGAVDFVPGENVHEGDGEAFRLSGRAMDDMKRSNMLAVGCADGTQQRALQVVTSLLDAVTSGWTASQARAVAGALRGWTQEKIAETWPGKPIPRQTAGKHLQRAHWDVVREALDFVKETHA